MPRKNRKVTIYPEPNPAVTDMFTNSQGLRRELLTTAIKLSSAYMANLPVRTGKLKSGTRVMMATNTQAKTGPRPEARIVNDTFYSTWNLTGAGPGMHTRSTGNEPKFGSFKGDYTFTEALRVFGGA